MKPIVVRMLQSLVFILVAVWVLLSLLLYINQPKYVYFPYSKLEATPADAGLAYAEVHLTTVDGIGIYGWFVPHEHPRATLLFLHGNGGNISHRMEKLEIFNKLGLNIFIIDYRGYGLSTGNPSEKGTYLDAEAAWSYLTKDRGISDQNIIFYGESLGGAVATWLATQHKPGALILESSFTSVMDMGRKYYPYLPIRWISRIRYPTLDRINHVHAPLMIIHSPADDIVPYEQGRELFAAANEPKSFLEIMGDHNSGFFESGKHYSEGLDQFITAYFGQSPNSP